MREKTGGNNTREVVVKESKVSRTVDDDNDICLGWTASGSRSSGFFTPELVTDYCYFY